MTAAIAVVRERHAGETRVAATPDSVRKLITLGAKLSVEAGAGIAASCIDADYAAAGADVVATREAALAGCDILLKVRAPDAAEIAALPPNATVVALLDPHLDRAGLQALAARGVSAFAMEFVPRISRAQAMDALSSQANLAGYRAVIEGAQA